MHMVFMQEEGTNPTQPARPGGSEGGDAPAQQQGSPFVMMVPLLLMFVVIYFMMIRPQRRKQKEMDRMISTLKKDDHVLTTGGIFGVVKQVKSEGNELIICIDEKQDVRIRVNRSAIAGLVKSSGAAGEGKAESAEPAKS